MRPCIRHIINWLPTVAVTVAVLWLTLAPDPVPDTGVHLFKGADKVVHFAMFFGLTAIALADLQRHKKKLTAAATIVTAVIAVVFAGADEIAQGAMGLGRTSDILDFAADSGGVMAASAVMWVWFRRGERR